MTEDLTPDEQEALELLRDNAPEAPEALASLDEAARARVLEALSSAGTGAPEPDDPVASSAVNEPADETPDDEPTLEDAPVSLTSSPTTFADRLLAQKVTVADKQVPLVPSAVGLVLLLVAVILLVRACGGNGNSLEPLAAAGMEAVDELDDAADKVGDERLFDAADRVREAMRRLTRVADADEDDLDEMMDAGEAVVALGTRIAGYVKIASHAALGGPDEETVRAAAEAARTAARIATNDNALDQAESLAKRVLDVHIQENARRPDSDDVDDFREATIDLIDAARAFFVAGINDSLSQAQLAEDRYADGRGAFEEAEEAYEALGLASNDYFQAADDFVYFGEQVEWRSVQCLGRLVDRYDLLPRECK